MNLMASLFTALITAVFIENVIVMQFLGICPFLGVSKKTETAVSMGVAVTLVMTIASAATWLINELILVPLNLDYMQTMSFILVIAAFVQFIELFIKKTSASLYQALGVYLPLITTNCAVLGIALVNIQAGTSFGWSVANGAFSGLGFLVAIVLFSGIRERMENSDIPESLKGFPSSMIAASLVSLAFFGFQGMHF